MPRILTLLTLLLLMPLTPARAAAGVDGPDSTVALVSIPVAHLRSTPAHAAEMASQAILGTPLTILDSVGEWRFVRLPDSYTGYIHSSSVTPLSPSAFSAWKSSPRLIAVCPATADILTDSLAGPRISYLLNGAIVQGTLSPGSRFVKVTLPDNTSGYAPADALMPLDSYAPARTDIYQVLATAASALGAPYLWGGTTLLAPDCSGLVKCAFFSSGLILPRDASQQALVGIEMPLSRPDLWMQGDLLFFSGSNSEKITHVAIYDRNTRFIHASGRVFTSSISKDDPLYIPRPVVKVVRIAGCENTPGITHIHSHPLYF
ncbi:MAG: C40 family peptidase [Muribaculaceae bacterium]|nr:C40 family peptidase [Muribaculaceae bacterium]